MIDQVNVFLENEKGRLASLCATLAATGIDMHALMVADTSDFGIVRIVCDDPCAAAGALGEAGYRARLAPVAAVEVPGRPGGLAELLSFLDDCDIDVEYLYCFAHPAPGHDASVAVMKLSSDRDVAAELARAGFHELAPADLYA